MIKATPSLTLPESVSSFNVDTFLFLKSYLNTLRYNIKQKQNKDMQLIT